MATSNDSSKNIYNIEKLKNDGRNYRMWSIRCRMILVDRALWDFVDPKSKTSDRPSSSSSSSSSSSGKAAASSPDPAIVEWDKKNSNALTQIALTIEDTPLSMIEGKDSAKEAWVALLKRYNGVGAQDAARVMTQLHHYQLDDSKPLEPQLIEMRGLRDRLASLGDTYTDAKFAMIVSEALPESFDTLKTITLADLDDASTIACDKLIAQILREEKRKSPKSRSSTALIAKSGKLASKDSDKSDGKKSKKTKDRPRLRTLTVNGSWDTPSNSVGRKVVVLKANVQRSRVTNKP